MDIEFASGVLEPVSGGCLGALSNYFVNTTLNVGTFEILLLKEETHETHECAFGVSDQILISHDVERVLIFANAVADQGVKEPSHACSLLLNEPFPILGVVSVELKLSLVAVANCVAKSRERWENIKRMSDTNESLSCGELSRKLHLEWVMRLGNHHIVSDMEFTFKAHDLKRGGGMRVHTGTCGQTGHLLAVSTQEGVA